MYKKIKGLILNEIGILKNPEKEFSTLSNKNLESVVFNYVKQLLLLIVVASVVNFVIMFLRVLYLDIFLEIDINYYRFLNFALGQSAAISIIYLVSGTFLVFFVSMFLNIFIRKIKNTELVKKILYSLTPILLFGITPLLATVFLIWSAFLFILGVKLHKEKRIDKTSIEQRD
jgi:hypothetical protein